MVIQLHKNAGNTCCTETLLKPQTTLHLIHLEQCYGLVVTYDNIILQGTGYPGPPGPPGPPGAEGETGDVCIMFCQYPVVLSNSAASLSVHLFSWFIRLSRRAWRSWSPR